MVGLPFFKFDAVAWLTGKVQLLTPVEKGIFIDLVARIWHENGELKNTEFLCRQIRVDKATLSEALQAFFDLGIMEEKDGVLRVKFIGEQMSVRQNYIDHQRACGARGGRPKKGAKPKPLHEKGQGFSENREIQEKVGQKENREKKDTPPCGGDSAGTPARENPAHAEFYPKNVDEVLKLAEDPRCAVVMTRAQAEKYFLSRTASDWIDGCGRQIKPGNIWADLRKWHLKDQSAAGVGEEIPVLKLDESVFAGN